jgi:hypothetical protein
LKSIAAAVVNYFRGSDSTHSPLPISHSRDRLRQIIREELRELLTDPALLRTLQNPLVGTVFPFAAGMACSGGGITASTNTAGQIPKWNTGCDLADSIMKEASSQIGIGLGGGSPSATLHVKSAISNAPNVLLEATTTNASSVLELRAASGTGGGIYDVRDTSNVLKTRIQSDLSGLEYSFQNRMDDGFTTFYTKQTGGSLTERMRLTAAGNLGLGTPSPQSKLTVKGGASVTASGTVAVSSTTNTTTVTGTGTSFTTEVAVGDRVTIVDTNETRIVTEITNNTSLKVDKPFTVTDGSSQMTVLPAIFRLLNSSGGLEAVIMDNGGLQVNGSASFGDTPVNESLAAGFIVVEADATYLNTQQEIRSVQATIRSAFPSSTDRDSDPNSPFFGQGWDRFGLGAAVAILPENKEYIHGQQKGIASELYTSKPTTIDAWQASTAYAVQKLVRPTSFAGRYYRVTTAGTSGGSQPTWPTTDGGTVTDGSVEWTETPLVGLMFNYQAYVEVGVNTSLGAWYGIVVNPPTPVGTANPPDVSGKIRTAYGIYIQGLDNSGNSAVTAATTAAIKIDGLNEYGRILWNGSSIYEAASGELVINSTKLGFYGATPVTRPTVTGSKGGNAALASLIAALANLGLIIDSTS